MTVRERPDYILIVAAAGEGRRLREASGGTPKPLLLISGKPILSWTLEALRSQPPRRAIIVANPAWMKAALALARAALPDVDVTGVGQPKPLGTLDALRRGLAGVADATFKEWPVAFLHADNVPPLGLVGAGLELLADHEAVLFSRRTSRPGSSARVLRDGHGQPFALAAAPGSRAQGTVEICGGLFLFGPWIWERFSYDQPPRRGELEIDSLNDELLRAGRAAVLPVEGTWLHINTSEDFHLAEETLLSVGSAS
ncbi:MAG: NTP transferase domain-containing protein [Chloroflexota bacterium]